MSVVTILFGRLTDILLLRRGPQDLPQSSLLLAVLVLLNLLAGTFLFADQDAASSESLQSTVDLGLSLFITAAVLNFRGFRERVLQTLTAFMGTGFILTLVLFPISLLLGSEGESFFVSMGRMMFLALLIWSLAVDGHIFRHALSTTMLIGTACAVGIFIARVYILETIWPG